MSRVLLYGACFALGLSIALWLLSPTLVQSWPPDDRAMLGDPAAHVIGQRYFTAGPWAWNILSTPSLGLPDGTTVALTDSVPLAALVTKALAGLLPQSYQSISLWLALCFVLQPVSGLYALRSAGEMRVLPGCCFAICMSFMPALLARYVHEALSSHFVILLALGLYFRLTDRRDPTARWFAFLLPPICLLIHPYLLVMVTAVLSAAPLSLLLRGDPRWSRVGSIILGAALVTGLLGMTLGYAGAADPGGFGSYSMNLLSPILPVGSWLIPWFGTLAVGQGRWWEGYNYLGAGVLLLALAAAICLASGSNLRSSAQRNAGLIAACGVMAAFALSNRVYLGEHLVLDLGDAPNWLGQARATGRFFWPAAYALTLVSVLAVARQPGRATRVLILACAPFLQIADTTRLRESLRGAVTDLPPWSIDASALRALTSFSNRLTILPPIGCGTDFGRDPQMAEVLLIASERAIPVNTVYAARYRRPPTCEDFATMPLDGDELRVFLPGRTAFAALVPSAGDDCRLVGDLAVCSHAVRQVLPRTPAVTAKLPAVAVGGDNALPSSAFMWGWCDGQAGTTGRWTCADSASVAFNIEGLRGSAASLTVQGHVLGSLDGDGQTVDLLIDGKQAATSTVPNGSEVTMHVAIGANDDRDHPIQLTFNIAKPVSPFDLGRSYDTRRLGLWLDWVHLEPSSSPTKN